MNNINSINIVSFDVPYPPDYGGVIDVYYKIKAFYDLGIDVYLHCFNYGKGENVKLEKICKKVFYYKRNFNPMLLFSKNPFIVNSRKNKNLLNNLLSNNYPILFEGLHCTHYINNTKLKERFKIVRMHNIEHDYYENLYNNEENILKKLYYKIESNKLFNYEKTLNNADLILAISNNDFDYLNAKYKKTINIGAFHPNEKIESKEGLGSYVLYHGNLEINENAKACIFLIKDIFNDIQDIPLIIAGKNPSKEIINLVKENKNIKLIKAPSSDEIYNLIKDAQINILPAFQSTGIKLKLLAGLFMGRWCIVNKPMVENTGLENLCLVEDDAEKIKQLIKEYFTKPFKQENISQRVLLLEDKFNNRINARKIIDAIYCK